jgi:hypothetical protein
MDSELLSLREILDPAWKRFITEQPEAVIFHHPAWAQLLAESYGYRPFLISLSDFNGNIQAGLPFIEVSNLVTRRSWVSLPFTDYCVPLYINIDAQKRLYHRLVHLTHQSGIPGIEVRWGFSESKMMNSTNPYYLAKISLDPDLDEMFQQIHHSHRRNVRYARNHGVRVEFGFSHEHIYKYYELHVQTRKRQGVPVQPWRFFELLEEFLIRQGLGFVLLAYLGRECLAGAVFLHWGQTLTYKYGASRVDGLALRPNHLIFWEAIQWGCENNYKIMDLGRTDIGNTGLRDFKKRWGAEETPLSYTAIPTKKSSNISHKLLPLIKTVIQHSPAWVCRLAGYSLYKYSA